MIGGLLETGSLQIQVGRSGFTVVTVELASSPGFRPREKKPGDEAMW